MIGPDSSAAVIVAALGDDDGHAAALEQIIARWNRAALAHIPSGLPWEKDYQPADLSTLQRESQPAVDVLDEFSKLWLSHCYNRAHVTLGTKPAHEHHEDTARLHTVFQRDFDAADFGGHKGRGRLAYWARFRVLGDWFGLHRELSASAGNLRTEIFEEIVNLVIARCLTPNRRRPRQVTVPELEIPA